jgi:hypothetical protein
MPFWRDREGRNAKRGHNEGSLYRPRGITARDEIPTADDDSFGKLRDEEARIDAKMKGEKP